jgi:putative inorganic carbon (hco3(-)) transporter
MSKLAPIPAERLRFDLRRPAPADLLRRYGTLELALTVVLAPWFIFPNPGLTPWLFLVPPLLWLLRWALTGRPVQVTPLNAPLGLLLLALGVSTLATYDVHQSFPKIAGVYYGLMVTFALAQHLRGRKEVRVVAVGLFIAGVCIAVVGLLGTRWGANGKLPLLDAVLQRIYGTLPAALRGLPRAEEGFNANQIGGTLAMLVPLQAALWLDTFRHRRGARALLLQAAAGLGLTLTAAVLVLSVSRTAVAATSGALWLLCLVAPAPSSRRSRRLPLPRVLLICIVLAMTVVAIAFILAIEEGGTGDDFRSLSGRSEIWQRSWTVLRDHAWTGIGFDTLPPVVHARYPTFQIRPGADFTHAHNLLLQVALDLGVPGLISFIAVLLVAGACLVAAARRARGTPEAALALGLLLGLVGYTLYGTTDAIALGQKPGLLLWIYLGVAGAMARCVEAAPIAGEDTSTP